MPAESTILVLGVTDPHLQARLREEIGVCGAAAQFDMPDEGIDAGAVVLFVGKQGTERVREYRASCHRALLAITDNPAFAHAQALLDAGADDVILSSQLERLPLSLAAATKAAATRSRREQSYALQKAVNDHSPTEIFVEDLDGRFIYVNNTTAERYAQLTGDIIGKRAEDVFPPAQAAAMVDHDRQVLVSGQVATRTVTILDHHLQVTKFPVYDRAGEIIALGGIAVDVSEQQKALQALRTSESRLQDYAELAADIFYETGPDWLLTRCDGRLQEITGVDNESVIAVVRPQITHQDRAKHPEKWRALNQQLKRHEAVSGFELEWTRSDGKRISLLNNIKPMFDTSGEFIGYRGVAVDVTTLREAESALRANEERFRSLIENASDIISVLDGEGRIRFQSPSVTRILGYDTEDMLGHSLLDYIHTEDRHQVLATIQRILAQAGNAASVVFRLRHKSGDWRNFEARGRSAARDGDLEIILHSRDISDRVQVEAALRDSEQLLLGIMDHSPNEVFIKDLDKRYVYINKRCEELFGITNEHVKGKRSWDIFPSATARRLEQHDEQVLETQHTVIHQQDVPYVDGKHTVIIAKFPIRDASGEVVSIGAVTTDITDGSAAARALRVSEEHFRNLVEGSLQGILIHNLEDVLFVNQTLLDIFGYASLDEIRTAYAERRIIATHDSERIREFAEARLAGSEGPQRYELDAVKADGSLMQIEASGRRINWQGRPALQTTVLDITERKRAERALQSELRRNQIVLKSSQDGFFTCDLNGKLRDVNRAYERMLGYAPGEMAGMDLADIEANKSPTEVAESLARIAREGQGFFEVKHRHKQGFTVDFEVSVTAAIIDEDPFIFSFMRDVTDRNKALADLRESQAQLHALTMLAPAGIFRTDKDGRTTYVNEHWSELTGIATSKPGGDDWTYFLHEEDRERVLKHWRDRLASRTVFRDEYRYQRPQGSLVWVYCVANPQYNQQAEFTGYIGALTNITARKQAQAELENYRDHLEELVDARTAELRTAVREQESFSYSVSHDLRSPLRTIDGFSHMLLDEYSEVLDAEGKQCLQRVRAASQRMGLLIDALLNLSRMSRRKMRYETVDVSEIANDIVRRLRRTDPERDAQIEVAEELRAKGDSALLRVVLENLLNNAWKYSNKQTHTRIEVARIDGRGSGFLVRDNGVGFDMRYADRLFKPFQRLHTFEEFEGTGIGLATVVRIIERHGGKVWAESEEGKGATFYFTV